METCVGPHTYAIFALLFLSLAYGVHTLEDSIAAKFIAATLALVGCYIGQKLIPRGRVTAEGKAVFITGCDYGFGYKLALRLDELGFRVFAGCLVATGADARQLASNSSKRLTVVACDVTSDESVLAAQKLVLKKVSAEKLVFWACVNNAGIQRWGEIEMIPLKVFQNIFDVNTWGMVRVTKAFIPMIRQSKGRFINVTSVMGRWCNPTNSMYCMSKSAAETFCDVLRYEMHKWGVKVVIIEPGPYGNTTRVCAFGTDREKADEIWKAMDDVAKRDYGRAYVERIIQGYAYHCKQESYIDNTPVIDTMVEAILSKHPKHRYIIAGLLAPASYREFVRYNLLPTWLSDLKMYREQKKLGPAAGLQKKKKDI